MSDTPATEAKAPARPRSEILADIESERSALAGSFGSLRGDLDEAVAACDRRARNAAKKAAVIAPVAAGVVVIAAVGTRLLTGRSRRGRPEVPFPPLPGTSS